MFEKNYDQRLVTWAEFRKNLEESQDPISDVINLYRHAPAIRFYTDPWDESRWPSPWELLQENEYCEFNIVLGMYYSLQLTERFKHTPFEIHICVDEKTSSTHYLLKVGDTYIGYPDNATTTPAKNLPNSLSVKKIHSMYPAY